MLRPVASVSRSARPQSATFDGNDLRETGTSHRWAYDASTPPVRSRVVGPAEHQLVGTRSALASRRGRNPSVAVQAPIFPPVPAAPPATTGDTMTETHELDTINEAVSIIDRALGEMLHRELVSTDEVSDLLLDVRTLLTTDAPALAQN
jgi:hypothetical protein